MGKCLLSRPGAIGHMDTTHRPAPAREAARYNPGASGLPVPFVGRWPVTHRASHVHLLALPTPRDVPACWQEPRATRPRVGRRSMPLFASSPSPVLLHARAQEQNLRELGVWHM